MESRDFNPDFFTQQLEQILASLRAEIDNSLSPLLIRENREELDNYLYELNSFYYRSFNERLFPVYKSSVQEEITRLLKISSQEAMIKMDIMANIKRYAKLYNQVKKVLSIFKESRENAGEALLAISREEDHRTVELLYTLKQLQGAFTKLEGLTTGILNWMQDRELIPILQNHPAALPALQLISFVDRDNPVISDAISRLLIYLTYLARSISRLQPRHEDKKQMSGIIEEMKSRHPEFLPGDGVQALADFYQVQIEANITLNLNVLSLGLMNDEPDLFNHTLRDFENWLTGLIKLIEKATTGYSPAVSSIMSLNDHLQADVIKKLDDDTRTILKALTGINNDLSDSSEPDFTYFSNRTLETLEPFLPLLQETGGRRELACFPELNNLLNRLEVELSLLRARIDLLNQKQEHHNEVLKRFLSIVNMLDNYLNLLANIRADLERILAPRNISRAWKEVAVKVERIPLEKGQVFPPDYLYLLDKHLVETRIAEDEQENNLVLYEEGDIFIIRVDELLEEEMPYLLIAQKG